VGNLVTLGKARLGGLESVWVNRASSAVSDMAAEISGQGCVLAKGDPVEAAAWQPTLSLLSHAAAMRLFRSALRRLEGRTVDAELIQEACGALGGGGKAAGRSSSGGPAVGGETRAEGLIRMADFAVYLRSFGTRITLGLLVLATLLAALLSIADGLYLAHWTSDPAPSQPQQKDSESSEVTSLVTYVSLGFASQLFAAVQTVLLTLCALRASHALHAAVLRAVIGAPMAFFDATPSGSVLNRMLSDMQARGVGDCARSQVWEGRGSHVYTGEGWEGRGGRRGCGV
jgi:hypothetical protein